MLPALARLTSLPDAGAATKSLASHLVSEEDTPMDSFVGGTIVRLDAPRHIDVLDIRGPIIVTHVGVGGTGSEFFVGPLVAIKRPAGVWRILVLGDVMAVIS